MDSFYSMKALRQFQSKTPTPSNFEESIFNRKNLQIHTKNLKFKTKLNKLYQNDGIKTFYNNQNIHISTSSNPLNFNTSRPDMTSYQDHKKLKSTGFSILSNNFSGKDENDFNDIQPLVSYYHFKTDRSNINNELEKYNGKLTESQKIEIKKKYKFVEQFHDDESEKKRKKRDKNSKNPLVILRDEFYFSQEKALKNIKLNKQIYENVSKIALKVQANLFEKNYIKIVDEKNKIDNMPCIRTSQRQIIKKEPIKSSNNLQTSRTIENKHNFGRDAIIYNDMELTGSLINFTSNKPNARAQSSLVMHKENLYLFGGVNNKASNDMWICGLNNKFNWKKIVSAGDQPLNRYGHTSVVYKDEIYIFGGLVDTTFQAKDDIVIYSIAENYFNIDQKCLNKNGFRWRRNHICELVGYHMVIYGGLSNDDTCLDDIWALDLNNLKWYQIPTPHSKPPALAHMCSTLVLSNEKKSHPSMSLFRFPDIPLGGRYRGNNKIEGVFIFGGMDDQRKFNDKLFILKVGKNPLSWFCPETSGNGPEGLINATLNYFEKLDILILFGGKNKHHEYKNDFFVFDLEKFEWIRTKTVHEIPKPRSEHVSILTPNDQLLIIGGIDGSKYLGSDIFAINLSSFTKKSNIFDLMIKRNTQNETHSNNLENSKRKSIIQLQENNASQGIKLIKNKTKFE